MRSGRIQGGDRVVLVEGYRDSGPGSSYTAREVTRTHVAIDDYWDATYDDRMAGAVVWLRRGTEVVSCLEAARRGIGLWAEAFAKHPRPEKRSYTPVDIFNP